MPFFFFREMKMRALIYTTLLVELPAKLVTVGTTKFCFTMCKTNIGVQPKNAGHVTSFISSSALQNRRTLKTYIWFFSFVPSRRKNDHTISSRRDRVFDRGRSSARGLFPPPLILLLLLRKSPLSLSLCRSPDQVFFNYICAFSGDWMEYHFVISSSNSNWVLRLSFVHFDAFSFVWEGLK